MKSIAEEIRHRMNDVCTGMTDLVGLVKDIPDQYTAGSALLEENLAASIVASLRDENQKHFDGINDALFEMENKLHGIKKLVKKGGGGGGEDGDELGWKNVMERIECVSGRLESVQGVLENSLSQEGEGRGFDVALVLTEVRKRAKSDALDRLSQDMFKAIHNVQRRLLEEHVSELNLYILLIYFTSCRGILLPRGVFYFLEGYFTSCRGILLPAGVFSSWRGIVLPAGVCYFLQGYFTSWRGMLLPGGVYYFLEGYFTSWRGILLPGGVFYFMEGYFTSWRGILLHGGVFYFLQGYFTSCRGILLPAGVFYFLQGYFTFCRGYFTSCRGILLPAGVFFF